MGDFGGLYECLVIIINVLISSWASFNFHLKAMQKLYLVKTKEPELLRTSNSKKNLQFMRSLRQE